MQLRLKLLLFADSRGSRVDLSESGNLYSSLFPVTGTQALSEYNYAFVYMQFDGE